MAPEGAGDGFGGDGGGLVPDVGLPENDEPNPVESQSFTPGEQFALVGNAGEHQGAGLAVKVGEAETTVASGMRGLNSLLRDAQVLANQDVDV